MDTSNLQIVLSAEQQHHELLLREASDGLRRHSSISDATMWTSEEFDPPQEQLRVDSSHSRVVSMGDAHGPVVVHELRHELAEIGQAYHYEARAFQRHYQEFTNRHTMQTHLAMIEQHSQFSEAALNYERAAATIAEARIAQERTEHQSDRARQSYEYMTAIIEIQDRVRQREQMLENAQSAYQEALGQHYAQAITAERAQVVADAENILRQERIQQQELAQNMEQSQAAAD